MAFTDQTVSRVLNAVPTGLLIGGKCGAHTVPYIEAKNSSAVFEHEATTSKISEEMLFYCMQRGLSQEDAVALVVWGMGLRGVGRVGPPVTVRAELVEARALR